MNLVRDVLDQQIIDARNQKSGKVDGIALELREGEPPRVAYIETGVHVLARRLGHWLERIALKWAEPTKYPWPVVEEVLVSVRLKVEAGDFRPETWLREHIIEKIPGHAHHKHQEKKN